MAKGESKSYNPAAVERRIFDFWMQGGYFVARPDERPREQRFCVVIPPPNVTGALHLGHALNNTLQDILVRQKRMAGLNTFWLVGTDHAGIATQAVVEKTIREEEGRSRHDLGREELVRRIWEWKEKHGGRIIEQLKLMGCSCDYSRERFTLDEGCARAVRETFFKLFRDGLIYRGKRLVNWDTQLQTAVADDEVYHEQVKGHFYHFRYPIAGAGSGEPGHVHIATTRPETMLADTAVAVHPDPAKAMDDAEREARARLADAPEKEKPALQARLDDIAERKRSLLPTLIKLRDMSRAGRRIRLPLTEREIPLICDEWADPTLGTGCVKITPAHDPNDYEVARRHRLPLINVLTPDGRVARIVEPDGSVNAHSWKYEGLRFSTKAREKVVEDMEALGLVVKIEDRLIDLGHSDRSKTAIEPYLSDQWFVRMGDLPPEQAAKIDGLRGATGLAQLAIDAVKGGRVKFHPERYAKTYLDWLAEKRDWCISRQLWWGHRIPVWTGPASEHASGEEEAFGRLTSQWAAAGRISRRFDEPSDGLRVDAVDHGVLHLCVRNESDKEVIFAIEQRGFRRDPDVLDTWFSSALWPHSTLGWPEPERYDNLLGAFYPTSVLSTAREIITLWVARMVMTGLYNVGQVPFDDVVIHAVIQDGQGRKMSKTLGNGVDPVDIIEEYGADALRFTLADLSTETQDIRLPVKPKKLPDGRTINVSEKFEKGRNFCNKLWQAATGFVLRNLEGYAPEPLDPKSLRLEDRWILSRMTACQQQLDAALASYRFADAAGCVYRFMWDEYCSWYIELVKPRLAGSPRPSPLEAAGEGRAAARQILVFVLDRLLRMLHPFVPFVTEAIWAELNAAAPRRGLRTILEGEPALVAAAWPSADLALREEEVEAQMLVLQGIIKAARDIRAEVNDYRGRAGQPSVRTLARMVVRGDDAVCRLVESCRALLLLLAGCESLETGVGVNKPAGAMGRLEGNVEVYCPVADLIDLAEVKRSEAAKLKDLHEHLAREDARLGRDDFVRRADPAVVEQARMRRQQLSSQIQALERHLAEIG